MLCGTKERVTQLENYNSHQHGQFKQQILWNLQVIGVKTETAKIWGRDRVLLERKMSRNLT